MKHLILPTEESLVIFFSPLEKLNYLSGKGLFVHSARLTVREIPIKDNYKSSWSHNSVQW